MQVVQRSHSKFERREIDYQFTSFFLISYRQSQTLCTQLKGRTNELDAVLLRSSPICLAGQEPFYWQFFLRFDLNLQANIQIFGNLHRTMLMKCHFNVHEVHAMNYLERPDHFDALCHVNIETFFLQILSFL